MARRSWRSYTPDIAPQSVRNSHSLANAGFYNGLIFHRRIYGFMIQGAAPRRHRHGRPRFFYLFSANQPVPSPSATTCVTPVVLSMARAQDMDSAAASSFIMHKRLPPIWMDSTPPSAWSSTVWTWWMRSPPQPPEYADQQAQEAAGDEVRHRGYPKVWSTRSRRSCRTPFHS